MRLEICEIGSECMRLDPYPFVRHLVNSCNRKIFIIIMNLPPHSASSVVVVVVITLLPSDAIQLRSLMGQLEPGNTFIS